MISPDPLVLTVPAETEDGPVSLSFETIDIAGRATTRELTWTVMTNQVPTVSLAFADGAPTTVLAGTSTTVVVHAEDAEGLASVALSASGPAVEPDLEP